MDKVIAEPDFVGGQGQLTKEEENAISEYLAFQKSEKKVTASTKVKKKVKADW